MCQEGILKPPTHKMGSRGGWNNKIILSVNASLYSDLNNPELRQI